MTWDIYFKDAEKKRWFYWTTEASYDVAKLDADNLGKKDWVLNVKIEPTKA